jgi:hypothetical protein
MKVKLKKYKIEDDFLHVFTSVSRLPVTKKLALKEIDAEHYLVKECLEKIKLCVGDILNIKMEGYKIEAQRSTVENMLGDLRKNGIAI